MMKTSPNLILASQSPRRRYLLEQAGLSFEVVPSTFDEDTVQLRDPANYVRTLAEAKANEVAGRFADSWVIGADTIVTIGDAILGKPADAGSARKMLRQLSGQCHAVFTGYAVVCKNKTVCISDAIRTTVRFKTLSREEIDWYIESGEPFDKAGAYAIQGLGTFLVRGINGSYTNVVGLPVCEVVETLLRLGVARLERPRLQGVAM
jgi:septum formation protein